MSGGLEGWENKDIISIIRYEPVLNSVIEGVSIEERKQIYSW